MQDPTDPLREGKLDLVPMIDCIMLLLLFFILTTRFISEDKQIAALLPAHGQAVTPSPPVPVPPPVINLVVTPAGLPRGLDEHGYQLGWERLLRLRGAQPLTALLRIGGSDPLVLDATLLQQRDPVAAERQIAAVHAYVLNELTAREQAGARTEQATVDIHCFSGLSWGYALAVYDAVRAYEGGRQSVGTSHASTLDADQRTVTFAPPRIRNVSERELGQELWEMQNLR